MRKLRNSQISEEAADWAIRLDAGPLDSKEQHALANWLLESPMHVDELLLNASLLSAIEEVDEARPLSLEGLLQDSAGDVVPLMRSRSEVQDHHIPVRAVGLFGNRLVRGVIGVGVAAVIFAFIFIAPWANQTVWYETARGEQRSVVLEDGSVLYLNTLSRVAVEYSRDRRLLELHSGEALFDVKHDPSRPFRVLVGNSAVEALGTVFNIEYTENRTDVSVLRGSVAVGRKEAFSRPAGEGAISSENVDLRKNSDGILQSTTPMEDDDKLIIANHQQMTFSKDGNFGLRLDVDPETVTSWRMRRLVFEDSSLVEIAQEFNRYNNLQIEVLGSSLSSLRFSGVFDADDPMSLVQYLELQANVVVDHDEAGRIVIRSRT